MPTMFFRLPERSLTRRGLQPAIDQVTTHPSPARLVCVERTGLVDVLIRLGCGGGMVMALRRWLETSNAAGDCAARHTTHTV
jgi:hypothetical protein